MDWVYLLNSFDGRIGRKTFWIAMGAVFVANIAACLVAQQIDSDRLSAIVDLAFTYPEFAVTAKRSHDRELPLWILIVFFTANGVLDLFDVLGLSGTSDAPSLLSVAVALPFTALSLFLIVELGFRQGTVGPNRYGPDPLGGR